MKNCVRLTLLVLLFTTQQVFAKKVEIDGLIYLANDTVIATFVIPINSVTDEPILEKMLEKIRYYDSSRNLWIITPKNAKEVRFTYNYKHIRMISVKNTLWLGKGLEKSDRVFLKLEQEGRLRLYSYSQSQNTQTIHSNSGSSFYTAQKYILQKKNSELKQVIKLGFKKDMMQYFEDCPTLHEKIKNKSFRKFEIKTIVKFYNQECN